MDAGEMDVYSHSREQFEAVSATHESDMFADDDDAGPAASPMAAAPLAQLTAGQAQPAAETAPAAQGPATQVPAAASAGSKEVSWWGTLMLRCCGVNSSL